MQREAIERVQYVNALLMSKLVKIYEKKQELDPESENQLYMKVEDVESFLDEISNKLHEALGDIDNSNDDSIKNE
jgi:hypothetical protein